MSGMRRSPSPEFVGLPLLDPQGAHGSTRVSSVQVPTKSVIICIGEGLDQGEIHEEVGHCGSCFRGLLAIPAAYAASPGAEKPNSAQAQSAEDNAAKLCKAERERIGLEAFKTKYGTNKNKANAFGKCVSGKSKDKAKGREGRQGRSRQGR